MMETPAVVELIREMCSSMVRQLQRQTDAITASLEGKFSSFKDGVTSALDSVKTRVDEQIEQQAQEIRKFKEEFATNKNVPQATVGIKEGESGSRKMFKNLPTYNGDHSWSVYRTQFVAVANNWTNREKACALASSLRSPAVEILQTIPEDKRLDYESLLSALELRYGDLHRQPYFSLKLRTRVQGSEESLQELASDIERMARLAYQQCPLNIQDELAKQNFMDALTDPELQQSVRMANCPSLQAALMHAMNFEMAKEASKRNRRVVRAAVIRENPPFGSPGVERDEVLNRMGGTESHQNRRRNFRCWACQRIGHIAAECPLGYSFDRRRIWGKSVDLYQSTLTPLNVEIMHEKHMKFVQF